METHHNLPDIRIDELNPTFLFTWKGKRTSADETYHSHDYTELIFVLTGKEIYRIEDHLYEAEEGDLIILNPGTKHQALTGETDTSATEFFVGFTDVQFGDWEQNHFPAPAGSPIFRTKGELRQKLFKLCTSMEAENSVCWQGRYFMLKTYLMQMLLLLLREQTEPVPVKTGFAFESINKKYVVEQIVNYFEEHYAEKISLDQVAGDMYLSPFYISKIFKSETGGAPIRYLINIRLEKAKELLEHGWTGSIQEVAEQVGYTDAYHFSKLFKKRYGVSPSQVKGKDV